MTGFMSYFTSTFEALRNSSDFFLHKISVAVKRKTRGMSFSFLFLRTKKIKRTVSKPKRS